MHDVIAASTDWDVRKQAYRNAPDIWVDETTGTILYNPVETYAMRKGITWKPCGLYYMDLCAKNLRIAQ